MKNPKNLWTSYLEAPCARKLAMGPCCLKKHKVYFRSAAAPPLREPPKVNEQKKFEAKKQDVEREDVAWMAIAGGRERAVRNERMNSFYLR